MQKKSVPQVGKGIEPEHGRQLAQLEHIALPPRHPGTLELSGANLCSCEQPRTPACLYKMAVDRDLAGHKIAISPQRSIFSQNPTNF